MLNVTRSSFHAFQVLLVVASIVLAVSGAAAAATSLFYFHNSLCVSIVDLRGDQKYTFRDDLSNALVPHLRQAAAQANLLIKIESREQCQRPDDPGYARQMRLDLSIKRQVVSLGGVQKHVAVIDAASPNAQGALSAYALMPTIIVEDAEISDRSISAALFEFVRTKIIATQ
jgi:hypothetical protein